jgi:hypothetical protein
MPDLSQIISRLKSPVKLWSRDELFRKPSPVPQISGIYAWYFDSIPSEAPTSGCIGVNGLALLYLGISPAIPTSRSNLRRRFRIHFKGNSYGSTLRLTLGCLLAKELGIELLKTGKSGSLTFDKGESKLSEWMRTNAFVTWQQIEQPWKIEVDLISQISPPLNIMHNDIHQFHDTLLKIRKDAKDRARACCL